MSRLKKYFFNVHFITKITTTRTKKKQKISAESAKGAYPNQGIIKLRNRIGSLRLTEA